MKKLVILCLLLFPVIAKAQVTSSTARRVRAGSSLPATCRATNPVDVFIRTGATNPGFYFCSASNTWSGPFSTGAGITNSATNGQVAISNGTNIVGDADLTFATDTLTATKLKVGGGTLLFGSGGEKVILESSNVFNALDSGGTNSATLKVGSLWLGTANNGSTADGIFNQAGTGLQLRGTFNLTWSNGSPISVGPDTGLSRISAGVVGVGTGAVGSVAGILSHTKGRLQPLTVSTLGTGTAGDYAYVTDGDAGLAWGATVVNTGAGATSYLVWFNGTNWTVAGK